MKRIFILTGIILLLISGCGGKEKPVGTSNNVQSESSSDQIRNDVKEKIDMLAYYSILEVSHSTWGISESRKFEPKPPEEFEAGKFKLLFQRDSDKRVVILQTEGKVGHLSKVIPGKTKVDGFISLHNDDNGENLLDSNGLILNKTEEEYFIKMLYSKFRVEMSEIDAININSVKDYALAIYFNGVEGIEEFHNRQK